MHKFRFVSPTVASEIATGSRTYEEAHRRAQERATQTKMVPGSIVYIFDDESSLSFHPDYYTIRT